MRQRQHRHMPVGLRLRPARDGIKPVRRHQRNRIRVTLDDHPTSATLTQHRHESHELKLVPNTLLRRDEYRARWTHKVRATFGCPDNRVRYPGDVVTDRVTTVTFQLTLTKLLRPS